MINPIFNLGVSARTNSVVWKYVSHQLSQAAVQRIDSLILDWTRNRALARPAVPLHEKNKKTKNHTLLSERVPNLSPPSLSVCLFLSFKVMFGLLIVYCSKEFLSLPWTRVTTVPQEMSIFGDTSGGGWGRSAGWPFSSACWWWECVCVCVRRGSWEI